MIFHVMVSVFLVKIWNSPQFPAVSRNLPGGAGSYLWSRRYPAFYDHPSNEICQSLENWSEHAQQVASSIVLEWTVECVDSQTGVFAMQNEFSVCWFPAVSIFCGSTEFKCSIYV